MFARIRAAPDDAPEVVAIVVGFDDDDMGFKGNV